MDLNRPSTSSSLSSTNSMTARDQYCWKCNDYINIDIDIFECSTCIRSYHVKCLDGHNPSSGQCPQCVKIEKGEVAIEKRDDEVVRHKLDMLTSVLKKVVKELKDLDTMELFHKPVDTNIYKDYRIKVVNPMDLDQVEENARSGLYHSTASFLADIKWIHHNCLVYNPPQRYNRNFRRNANKLWKKAVTCCQKIDVCVYCCGHYYSTKDNYFTYICIPPHNVVAAKLPGFERWPAKVTGEYDQIKDRIRVIFFGTYELEWVDRENCYLLSESSSICPLNEFRTKLKNAVREMRLYIDRLTKQKIKFTYYKSNKTVIAPFQLYLNIDKTIGDIICADHQLESEVTTDSEVVPNKEAVESQIEPKKKVVKRNKKVSKGSNNLLPKKVTKKKNKTPSASIDNHERGDQSIQTTSKQTKSKEKVKPKEPQLDMDSHVINQKVLKTSLKAYSNTKQKERTPIKRKNESPEKFVSSLKKNKAIFAAKDDQEQEVDPMMKWDKQSLVLNQFKNKCFVPVSFNIIFGQNSGFDRESDKFNGHNSTSIPPISPISGPTVDSPPKLSTPESINKSVVEKCDNIKKTVEKCCQTDDRLKTPLPKTGKFCNTTSISVAIDNESDDEDGQVLNASDPLLQSTSSLGYKSSLSAEKNSVVSSPEVEGSANREVSDRQYSPMAVDDQIKYRCDVPDCFENERYEEDIIEHVNQEHNVRQLADANANESQDVDEIEVIDQVVEIEVIKNIKPRRRLFPTITPNVVNRTTIIEIPDDEDDDLVIIDDNNHEQRSATNQRPRLLRDNSDVYAGYIKKERMNDKVQYRCTFSSECRQSVFEQLVCIRQHLAQHFRECSFN